MKPKIPGETAEQKQQRIRAESDNINSMQSGLQIRTKMLNRIRMPRVSIATGRSSAASSMAY